MSVTRDPSTGKGMEVNDEGQAVVRSITEPEIEHASGILGTAFSWDSGERDIDAGDTMLFIKNTSDIPLILDRMTINGSNVICTWEVYIGATTTTPSGTTVTPTNLNEVFATQAAEADSFYDETAVANGAIVERVKTAISESKQWDMHGIILGKNHYIQINQLTESTSGSILILGHFEAPS